MDLRTRQKPLKDLYRADPDAARITLRASGAQADTPLGCSIDLGRAIQNAEAHTGAGGPGTAACSGDILLGALAGCAQLTCQMVATAMEIPYERITVTAEGDLDLRGTLGVSRDTPVGFTDIRLYFDIAAPDATEEQLSALREKTERYCVVFQTLSTPPAIRTEWSTD